MVVFSIFIDALVNVSHQIEIQAILITYFRPSP